MANIANSRKFLAEYRSAANPLLQTRTLLNATDELLKSESVTMDEWLNTAGEVLESLLDHEMLMASSKAHESDFDTFSVIEYSKLAVFMRCLPDKPEKLHRLALRMFGLPENTAFDSDTGN